MEFIFLFRTIHNLHYLAILRESAFFSIDKLLINNMATPIKFSPIYLHDETLKLRGEEVDEICSKAEVEKSRVRMGSR